MNMPKWTSEQSEAIYKKGTNIIVSAGAGSGKTAVLSERVLEHVKSGISVNRLLVLTFTNAAAAEMKDRIRAKIRKVPELKDELDKVDIAYITTFDSFALSMVKKYSNYLNLSKNINIIDESIITLKKYEILEQLFNTRYEAKDELFLKLINDFTVKDDKEIFKAVLSLYAKLENRYDTKDYLDTYLENYYSAENIEKIITAYFSLIKSRIEVLGDTIDNLSHYTDNTFMNKLYEVVNPLLTAKGYAEIRLAVYNISRLPILRGATDEVKKIKEEVKAIIDEIKNLVKYNTLDEIKITLNATKDYAAALISLIKELDLKLGRFKKENNAYDFIDIAKMAIDILKKFPDIREEIKDTYYEILIDEYQDTNDIQDIFISLIENNNVYMVGDIKQSIYRFRNANPNLFKSKYDAYAKNDNGIKIDLNIFYLMNSKIQMKFNTKWLSYYLKNIKIYLLLETHLNQFMLLEEQIIKIY